MKLLIVIPLKSQQYYLDRFAACEATWLKDCGVDYKGFTDAELGLDENDPTIRQHRTRLMVKYAYDAGYDFVYRVDADAYVWVNRLLASNVFQYDYVGNCLDYPKHLEIDRGRRTAHGGAGFILSRRAMEIIKDWRPFPQSDGIYWGDIGTGELLWTRDIYCHRDQRFVDKGDGNFTADEIPAEHNFISVHPIEPQNLAGFKPLPDQTTPIDFNLFDIHPNWNYGVRRPDICQCAYCLGGRIE